MAVFSAKCQGGPRDLSRAADWEGNTAAIRKRSMRLLANGWTRERQDCSGLVLLKGLKEPAPRSSRLSLLPLRSRHSDISPRKFLLCVRGWATEMTNDLVISPPSSTSRPIVRNGFCTPFLRSVTGYQLPSRFWGSSSPPTIFQPAPSTCTLLTHTSRWSSLSPGIIK